MWLLVIVILIGVAIFLYYYREEHHKALQAKQEIDNEKKRKEAIEAEARRIQLEEQEKAERIAAEDRRDERIRQVSEAQKREYQLYGYLERAKTEMTIVERYFLIQKDVESFWNTVERVISTYEEARKLLPQIIQDLYKYQGKPSQTTFIAGFSPSIISETLDSTKKLSSLITQALQLPDFYRVCFDRSNQIFPSSKFLRDIWFDVNGELNAALRNYESTARELNERHK